MQDERLPRGGNPCGRSPHWLTSKGTLSQYGNITWSTGDTAFFDVSASQPSMALSLPFATWTISIRVGKALTVAPARRCKR